MSSSSAEPKQYNSLANINPSLKNYSRQKTSAEQIYLVKKMSQGDRDAFWKLWLLHQNFLFQRCLKWLSGNFHAAEEALSRGMLKIWSKLPLKSTEITNLKGWFTRILYHICMDIHRENKREILHWQHPDDVGVDNLSFFVSREPSPDTLMLDHELRTVLHQAIRSLSPALKKPFILQVFREMTPLDIAKQMGLSLSNVYKRIQKAKSIIRKRLKQYWSEILILPSLQAIL